MQQKQVFVKEVKTGNIYKVGAALAHIATMQGDVKPTSKSKAKKMLKDAKKASDKRQMYSNRLLAEAKERDRLGKITTKIESLSLRKDDSEITDSGI